MMTKLVPLLLVVVACSANDDRGAKASSTPGGEPADASTIGDLPTGDAGLDDGAPRSTDAGADASTSIAAGKGLAIPTDQLRWLTDAELSAKLDDLEALGAHWLRFDLYWSVVQAAGPAAYEWTTFDRIITSAHTRGLRVLPILQGTPDWARVSGTNVPADATAYGRFAKAAAGRYAPQGVHHWEIWNEPNLTGFFSTRDAARYTQLLKSASQGIKEVDPTATVITAGLSPVPKTGDNYIAATEFLTAIYANGGRPFFDAVGFHPYSWPLSPNDTAPWNGWRIMTGNETSVRTIMTANGDDAKPVWITEYGAPSSVVGEDRHAEMLAESFVLAKSHSWIGPLFWYTHEDRGTDAADPENFYGLRRYDGAQKPAYGQFKLLP